MGDKTENKKWIYLSYPLSPDTPAYGDSDSLEISHEKSMIKGDLCNTSFWSLSNHFGTHIDFPKHFVDNGKTADEYPADFWFFLTPQFIDISPVEPASIIGPEEINFENVSKDVDLLFIKTNFCRKRDKQIYWQKNPGFDWGLADYLREVFPNLKVLGFDCISLSSFAHREIGRKAHQAFLDHHRPILPLEDVDLSQLNSKTKLNTVIIAPLVVQNADAAPCTVLAEIIK